MKITMTWPVSKDGIWINDDQINIYILVSTMGKELGQVFDQVNIEWIRWMTI